MKKEDLIKRAKELILKTDINGPSNQIYKQAAENDPKMLEELLIEIAEQAEDKYSTKATNRIYGNELVGIALMVKAMSQPISDKKSIKEMVHDRLTTFFKT